MRCLKEDAPPGATCSGSPHVAPFADSTRVLQRPALIQEPFTVVVLPPGATATLDGLGNYVISV